MHHNIFKMAITCSKCYMPFIIFLKWHVLYDHHTSLDSNKQHDFIVLKTNIVYLHVIIVFLFHEGLQSCFINLYR
jgi:hypothetical protein